MNSAESNSWKSRICFHLPLGHLQSRRINLMKAQSQWSKKFNLFWILLSATQAIGFHQIAKALRARNLWEKLILGKKEFALSPAVVRKMRVRYTSHHLALILKTTNLFAILLTTWLSLCHYRCYKILSRAQMPHQLRKLTSLKTLNSNFSTIT